MPHDAQAALAVFTAPDERIPLDWYDGPVQAVYVHDSHGPWYVFAIPSLTPRERTYCLRPLVDDSVVGRIADHETLDGADWLEQFGRDVLLPACAAIGFRVTPEPGGARVEAMDEAELSLAWPRLANALFEEPTVEG